MFLKFTHLIGDGERDGGKEERYKLLLRGAKVVIIESFTDFQVVLMIIFRARVGERGTQGFLFCPHYRTLVIKVVIADDG